MADKILTLEYVQLFESLPPKTALASASNAVFSSNTSPSDTVGSEVLLAGSSSAIVLDRPDNPGSESERRNQKRCYDVQKVMLEGDQRQTTANTSGSLERNRSERYEDTKQEGKTKMSFAFFVESTFPPSHAEHVHVDYATTTRIFKLSLHAHV